MSPAVERDAPSEVTERCHAEIVTVIRASGFETPEAMFRELARQCERWGVTVAECMRPGFFRMTYMLQQSQKRRRDVVDVELSFSRPVPQDVSP